MTREEAIRLLGVIDTICEFRIGDYGEQEHNAMFMAIADMEKQIPKKARIWENKHPDSPVPNDDWGYECPCCGNRDIDYPEHHCTCGQALDWEFD